MTVGMLGRKIGMTRIPDERGKMCPVTVIEAGPCPVVQVKTAEKDGYDAVQLGFLSKKDSRLKKPEYYHFQRHGVKAVKLIREFRTEAGSEMKSGDTITVDSFSPGQKVHVSGVSKGRGFQGVVKRHGFRGGRASHGGKDHLRSPGSIGMCADPARVFKNMKMPGHMGNANVTIKNLDVVRIDADKNLLIIKGGTPGPNGSYLRIRPKEDAK